MKLKIKIPSALTAVTTLLAAMFTLNVNAAIYNVPGDYPNIQTAIDAASIGDIANQEFDTILVGPGTYFENLTIQDKTVILRSTDGPDVTIIDGGYQDRVLYINQSLNNENAVSTRPIIEGFTLTNGNAGDSPGGGVYVRRYADPTFRDCIIRNNTAGTGGGVYAGFGVCGIRFEDSLIADNNASGWGGGIYGAISCMQLHNSAVLNNTAGRSGGGVVSIGFCTGFGASDSIIAGNSAGGLGGAIYNRGTSSCSASARASNSLLVNNSAEIGGGVYVGSYGYAQLDFSTIANNTASSMGGGFYGEDYGVNANTQNPFYSIANSIIYGNTPDPVFPTVSRVSSYDNMNIIAGTDVEGCLSDPGDYIGGETNICADPLFVDPANNDYSLSTNSPAIDMAVLSVTLPNGGNYSFDMVDHDIDGNSRPEGDGYDIGAYEFGLPIIEALVNLDPNTLNLTSKGRWITGYINLPAPYDPNDVLLSSVMIDNSIPADKGETQDGVLMVKFDRDLLANYLAGENGQIQLTVTGEINGQAIFTGADFIKAIHLPANTLQGAERIQSIGQ